MIQIWFKNRLMHEKDEGSKLEMFSPAESVSWDVALAIVSWISSRVAQTHGLSPWAAGLKLVSR